jgi:hypothetical protein
VKKVSRSRASLGFSASLTYWVNFSSTGNA